jgi:hypothetical protein
MYQNIRKRIIIEHNERCLEKLITTIIIPDKIYLKDKP